ncbi:MAG: hypothetical protein AB7K24_01190 [Gemmataceae bacterium]
MENTPVHETEFVWRRLTDALTFGGQEYNGHWWLAILFPIMLVGLIYVGFMYVRDSRSVGWKWAGFLGLLRSSVYIILALMFLLPAKQHWDTTKIDSKVLLIFDVSGSMDNKDDLPSETMPVEKLLSRQDKIIQFLNDEQVAFLQKLREKTPVTVYRFGGRLDEEIMVNPEPGKDKAKAWTTFLKPKPPTAEEKLKNASKADQFEALTNSTNIDESLRSLLNREGTNMLQGIIVVSDGRNTNFNSQVFAEVQTRAAKMQVPIFTVAVGEHREPVNLRITELLVPEKHPPDEKFPVRVEIDGEGLADETVQAELEVYGPDNHDKPAVVIPAPATFKLGAGTPHAQGEFIIDPEKMPAELRNPKSESGKPELLQGRWKFVARVPVDKREIERKDNISTPEFTTVVKKPLRVLLFAGGPTRDYQFARTLFVREEELGRGEVSIYLQGARKDIQQDVKPERLLEDFPNFIKDVNDASITPEQKFLNFMQYDVIICFDPDWTQLREGQVKLLEEWVQRHAGGLIVVAGPVHTFELARPGVEDTALKPILDLYPVKLNDRRIHSIDRNTKIPWRLHFPGVTRETEFLKLDDEGDDPLSGWERFFTGAAKEEPGRELPLRRGFFDFYPVKEIKPGAKPLAVFADPKARTQDGKDQQPYLVSMQFGSGNVIYVGSGELWRLRMFKEAFHERIWTKLARYVGSGSTGAGKSRGRIDMGKYFLTHSTARMEAKLLGADMKPLDPAVKPVALITPMFLDHEAVNEFLKRHKDLAPDIVNELQSISPDLVKLNKLAEQHAVLREIVPAERKIELTPKLAVTLEDFRKNYNTPEKSDKVWEGWFAGTFEIGTVPGKYQVELQVPESNDTLKRDYTVKPSNPERSNTRPDPAQLFRTAGLYREVVRPRLNEETRNAVRPDLQRTNQAFGASSEDDYRLIFDLPAADKITECLIKMPPRIHRSRGKVEDLWDSGFLVGTAEQPYKISYALLVIIGILSLEWLTRKLLRLA